MKTLAKNDVIHILSILAIKLCWRQIKNVIVAQSPNTCILLSCAFVIVWGHLKDVPVFKDSHSMKPNVKPNVKHERYRVISGDIKVHVALDVAQLS